MNTASKMAELIRLLNQETDLYRSLHTVLHREQDAAVLSDLDLLAKTAGEKEHLISDLRQKEKRRCQIVAALAAELGIAGREVTLTSIANAAGEPYAGRLQRINIEFRDVINSLQTANERNRELVEHSLALLRGSFNLLNDLTAPGTIYYRSGNIRNSKSTGNCISSEI